LLPFAPDVAVPLGELSARRLHILRNNLGQTTRPLGRRPASDDEGVGVQVLGFL
jgi:hypothetical protein